MNQEEFFQEAEQGPKHLLPERVAYLIHAFNRKTITETEHDELDEWITQSLRNQKIFEDLTDPAFIRKWVDWREKMKPEEALQRIKEKTGIPIDAEERKKTAGRGIRLWPLLASVAAILACIIFGRIWFQQKKSATTPTIAKRTAPQDLLPGGKHARLTLSDGTVVLLDTGRQGKSVLQTGIEVFSDSGLLAYSNTSVAASVWNQLTTPAGGYFEVRLTDGTRVWLNASSSLHYPQRFGDSVRKVELTGEGYFEVAKDTRHPFIVAIGNNQVRVLGTHFNVNGYEDANETIVTLAEGSVKLNNRTVLKPGEYGRIDAQGKIGTGSADLETALAWKRGEFMFRMEPLEKVMLQVAHWYDAKIIYQDNVTAHFNAEIPRNVPVSRLLEILEATGQVHFKIEANTITVLR